MFQVDLEAVRRALRPAIVPGKYVVVVKSAARLISPPYVVRLWLEVSEGEYAGKRVPFTFKEPHPEQSEGGLRNCLHALHALGVMPSASGEFKYDVSDLVGRRCVAELQIQHDHSGRLRVAVVQEGLSFYDDHAAETENSSYVV